MAKSWTYIDPTTRHPVHMEVVEGPITGRLVWLVSQRDLVERHIAGEVDALVRNGIGWPEIATALGVTRQAARQAWLRRHPEERVSG